MNTIDAAVEALRRAGEPLHVKDITKRMIDTDLRLTDGKTPEMTMREQTTTDIEPEAKKHNLKASDLGPNGGGEMHRLAGQAIAVRAETTKLVSQLPDFNIKKATS